MVNTLANFIQFQRKQGNKSLSFQPGVYQVKGSPDFSDGFTKPAKVPAPAKNKRNTGYKLAKAELVDIKDSIEQGNLDSRTLERFFRNPDQSKFFLEEIITRPNTKKKKPGLFGINWRRLLSPKRCEQQENLTDRLIRAMINLPGQAKSPEDYRFVVFRWLNPVGVNIENEVASKLADILNEENELREEFSIIIAEEFKKRAGHTEFDLRREAYDKELSRFDEGQKQLRLLPLRQMPNSIQKKMASIAKNMDADQFRDIINSGALGIIDELTDVVFNFLMRNSFKQGHITERQMQILFASLFIDTEKDCSKIRFNAVEKITEAVTEEIGGGIVSQVLLRNGDLNDPDTHDATVKLFVRIKDVVRALIYVQMNYAIYTDRTGQKFNPNQAYFTRQITKELEELANELSRFTQLEIKFDKPNLDNNEHCQEFIHTLLQLVEALTGIKIDRQLLLECISEKYKARCEHLTNNPDKDYKTSKQEAQAWEKLIEAYRIREIAA